MITCTPGRRAKVAASGTVSSFLPNTKLGAAKRNPQRIWNDRGETRPEQDEASNALLLRELDGVAPPKRTARFVCAMCLADPSGTVAAETTGTFEGVITTTPRGDNGFGYDPLFELPELGCTSAELPPEKKNALSHRGDAARHMAELLKTGQF